MFQDLALFPHLSVTGNIGYGLRKKDAQGIRRTKQQINERIDELLTQLELNDYADRLPHQLSGGQQQRVALARSLARQPDLLLLDEPFTALDPALRDRLREDLMQVIRHSGTTCILVTHDPDEALALADRIIVLRQGEIIQDAEPHVLLQQPADADVLSLFGRVNALAGEVINGEVTSILGSWPCDAANGPVTVRIREDALALQHLCDPETDSNNDDDGVLATVTNCYDWGHHVRYALELADGTTLWAMQLDAGHYENGSLVRVHPHRQSPLIIIEPSDHTQAQWGIT